MTNDPDLMAKVEAAVRQALAERPSAPSAPVSTGSSNAPLSAGSSQSAGARGILSATGRNRPGIVARLSAVLGELNVDIRDISQTVVGDFFTMVIVFDLQRLNDSGVPFKALKERLERAANGLGIHAVVIHEDILNAMHRV